MQSNHFSIYVFFSFLNYITCWPSFHFYSSSNPKEHVVLNSENLLSSGFSFQKQTKFIVHGFSSDGNKTSFISIKDNLLEEVSLKIN